MKDSISQHLTYLVVVMILPCSELLKSVAGVGYLKEIWIFYMLESRFLDIIAVTQT